MYKNFSIFTYSTKINGFMESVPLKIKCKKLASGKCQVQFDALINKNEYRGYLLTNPGDTLKEVMATINSRLSQPDVLHQHLYHVGSGKGLGLFLYKAK